MEMNHITETVAFLQSKLIAKPQIGIILGSGLGGLADQIENPTIIDYKDIPYFAVSTAPGHKGRFIVGLLGGKQVICMQGRLHFYEGHAMQDVIYPVRVMKCLGIETLIVTNAAGGVNLNFHVGDLMLITDHINLLGTNPLIGKNDSQFGPRFNDMSYAYAAELRELAIKSAKENEIELQQGVYMACTGPSYETPAEIRAFRTLGADAVGMSTVPEVIAASHCGLKVLAFSLITNMAAGVLDQPLSEQEVIEIGQLRGAQLQKLVRAVIEQL